eukprot:611608-Prorocentrum_minimum.AAC.2
MSEFTNAFPQPQRTQRSVSTASPIVRPPPLTSAPLPAGAVERGAAREVQREGEGGSGRRAHRGRDGFLRNAFWERAVRSPHWPHAGTRRGCVLCVFCARTVRVPCVYCVARARPRGPPRRAALLLNADAAPLTWLR